ALARSTTEQLTAGTRRWEADQARLRQLRLAQRTTEQRLARTRAQVGAEQAKVARVARQLAMRPLPTGLHVVLSSDPVQVVEALRAQQALAVTQGSQAQVVARAQAAVTRLRDEQVAAEQLVRSADALTRASARRLAALQALATRTAQRLDAAQSALTSALGRRAATARAEAARDRAAAPRALASRSRSYAAGGGALCTGRSTSGQANGNLDPASLCPLWQAPGHRMRADAAAAFDRMSQEHARTAGSPLCVTDSYRSYGEQVSVYQRTPGLAAVPGTSNHGWGLAVDLCGGVQTFGTPAYRWMKAHAGRFGFVHPSWAEPGGSKPEPWHWEHTG
ncbi:MAG: D-alanyl-D-alanine carboxypeptidase family protein, partial [Mycobacteriales bacterium]